MSYSIKVYNFEKQKLPIFVNPLRMLLEP